MKKNIPNSCKTGIIFGVTMLLMLYTNFLFAASIKEDPSIEKEKGRYVNPCKSIVNDSQKRKIPSDIPKNIREEIKQLYSSSPFDRARAVYNLGKLGAQATPAIPFLIDIIKDDSWASFSVATETEPPFITSFETSVGIEAVKALVNIGEPAVEPLIAALENKNKNIRRGAVDALEKINDNRSVEPLIATLNKEKKFFVRMGVASALGTIGDERAIEPLFASLQDRNPNVSVNAAKALWKINKDIRAIDALIKALNRKRIMEHIKSDVIETLEKITNQCFGDDYEAWAKWWSENRAKFNYNNF